mmetsp:Transcript_33137/g.97741  ORF Transcript_33137/g.97741 Transcript_33137/m.97741 type:complete len:200 (-) Transcript_33137:94-693(-)
MSAVYTLPTSRTASASTSCSTKKSTFWSNMSRILVGEVLYWYSSPVMDFIFRVRRERGVPAVEIPAVVVDWEDEVVVEAACWNGLKLDGRGGGAEDGSKSGDASVLAPPLLSLSESDAADNVVVVLRTFPGRSHACHRPGWSRPRPRWGEHGATLPTQTPPKAWTSDTNTAGAPTMAADARSHEVPAVRLERCRPLIDD